MGRSIREYPIFDDTLKIFANKCREGVTGMLCMDE